MEVTECLPTHAVVEILQSEHEKHFYKEITTHKGEKIRLTLTLPRTREKDEHFSQGVHMARAVVVGDDITEIKSGDLLLVDYSVDVDTARIIYNDGQRKLVDVVAKNVYYETDEIMPATNERPRDMYVWKKGDLDEITVVFGIIKDDGEVVPTNPFVILEYVVVDGQFEENENGILIPIYEGDVVMRRCLFAHPECRIKQGDLVIVPYEALYEREIYDKVISVCIDRDILAVMEFEKPKPKHEIFLMN